MLVEPLLIGNFDRLKRFYEWMFQKLSNDLG